MHIVTISDTLSPVHSQEKKKIRNGKPHTRVRFERHASRIVYDKDTKTFVVTWTKCNMPEKRRLDASRDPFRWMPSVAAIVTLCDRSLVPVGEMVHAAESIGRAYDAGDRELLDTEEAKKAAEMVRDLAYMNASDMDVCEAILRLLGEIAKVRFAAADFGDSILVPLFKACDECFAIEGFATWEAQSMRRRFLYCLSRKERTEVAYTLVSLLFGTGSCPLLQVSDRRILRTIVSKKVENAAGGRVDWHSACAAKSFLRAALGEMADAKASGLSSIRSKMTQQQLADSVCPCINEKKQGETQCSS